ncbi:MAG: ATP-binding protein [Chitinispirillaceae bacterium]|jgi:PAS domain S-box-containing protein|nr:ATP-binding protein [Chitinispirillaceae bacterium]
MTMTKEKTEHTGTLPAAMYETLQKAFSDFQVRAENLGKSYEAMQEEFRKVNVELDRKNAQLQESLAVQEEMQTYLGSILESMENGVIGVDVMGTITHFNRAAGEITGFAPKEMRGKRFADLFPFTAENEPALLQVLRTGRTFTREEKVLWHKDGHPVPVSFQTALLTDRAGTRLGAVEIFSDISRIKALEGEMQQSRTMAALGEMSATVAHEIRNPLGAMGMWAALLERDIPLDDKRSLTLKKIIEGLSRLNKIVSNLLVYTRPVKAEFRKMQLETLLGNIADFIEIEIGRLGHDITVRKNWDQSRRSFVLIDPEKIEQQVLMNLCLNAMQAMDNGGELRIEIESDGSPASEYECFSVNDTGRGIDPEDLPKIFDPFFTTKENGTGLGLAIVKKCVESHSGYLDVKSSVGNGTSFRVFLPKLKE